MSWGTEVRVVCIAAVLGLAGLSGEGISVAGREEEVLLVKAGDLAECADTGDKATTELLDSLSGTVFNVGEDGYEFGGCSGPDLGRDEARTDPVPGDREYANSVSGTGGYSGERPREGYYSYDLGDWHVIALDSSCAEVGECDEDSPLLRWLEEDLAVSRKPCTLAYWRHPLFSSGPDSNNIEMWAVWDALYVAGTDVVVNGHGLAYERFSPQTPEGNSDPRRGIREFVVDTGGKEPDRIDDIKPNSEVRSSEAHGVMKFTLHSGGYEWEFVPVEGSTFADSGSYDCH